MTKIYYLHENGELIFKNIYPDEMMDEVKESTFVKKIWEIPEKFKSDADVEYFVKTFLREAIISGANLKSVNEIAIKNKIDLCDVVKCSMNCDNCIYDKL
jgi:hypothetical protein